MREMDLFSEEKFDEIFRNDDVKKLHRRDAPETSVEAANKVNSGDLKRFVYECVLAAGEKGITAKEIVEANPNMPYSSITARPASLEEEGMIFYMPGEKRDGARVMRASVYKKYPDNFCQACGGMLLQFYNYKCQRCVD